MYWIRVHFLYEPWPLCASKCGFYFRVYFSHCSVVKRTKWIKRDLGTLDFLTSLDSTICVNRWETCHRTIGRLRDQKRGEKWKENAAEGKKKECGGGEFFTLWLRWQRLTGCHPWNSGVPRTVIPCMRCRQIAQHWEWAQRGSLVLLVILPMEDSVV